jgi:hypothetical protein
VRYVGFIKQISVTDFQGHLKKTNKYANEKMAFDEPCATSFTSKKALELQWFDTIADEL